MLKSALSFLGWTTRLPGQYLKQPQHHSSQLPSALQGSAEYVLDEEAEALRPGYLLLLLFAHPGVVILSPGQGLPETL